MTQTTTPVDLRAAARAFLADAGPLAIRQAALDRIVEIARSATPVLELDDATERELAFGRDDGGGHGRLNVQAGVAILPLRGVLTPRPSFLSILFGGSSGGLLGFRSDLREALGHNDVETIVIDTNSPGGSVSLIQETAAELRAARGVKRTIAVSNSMMASAAYEIGAQADEVVVTPSGFAGSIGVYLVHQDWSVANEQIGLRPTYISAGRYKTEANSDEPLDEVARAALQAEVDDFYAAFVEDVAAGRGATTEEVRAGYGEGRVLTAQRALAANLVDRVATLEEVVNEAAGGRRGNGAGANASGGPRKMRASRDNPGPNARVAEEVQARIAAVRGLTPPIVQPPGGNTA